MIPTLDLFYSVWRQVIHRVGENHSGKPVDVRVARKFAVHDVKFERNFKRPSRSDVIDRHTEKKVRPWSNGLTTPHLVPIIVRQFTRCCLYNGSRPTTVPSARRVPMNSGPRDASDLHNYVHYSRFILQNAVWDPCCSDHNR